MATNNMRVVHEGVIKDIVDILMDKKLMKDARDKLPGFFKSKDKTYFPNIAKATSNLVLTFPVIVDESVDLASARLIAKSVEQKMVSMLHMLFAAVDITNNDNAFDFIGKVHSNLNSDDVISFINKMDSIPLKNRHESTAELDIEAINDAMIKCMQEDNVQLDDRIPDALNDIYDVDASNTLIRHEAVRNVTHPMTTKVVFNQKTNQDEIIKKDMYSRDDISKVRLDNDVKKANDDVPSLMIIKFRTADSNDTAHSAVIGVKAKLVYVSQADMIDRIVTKNSDNNGLLNFLRATTGEISMIKDFLFAINRAKMDIISTKSNSSPIWKMLERRYIMSKKNWLTRNFNGSGTAIAVMVISSETETILARDYGFKCEPHKLLDIMEAYSVMGFIVADDVKERIKSLYDDNSNNFEIVSYSSLEKEDKTQYKKIINLITGGKE